MKFTDVSVSSIGAVSRTTSSAISKSMSIEVIGPDELCGALAERWVFLQAHNSNLTSPYFDIEFTRAVARVRDNVEIAVLHQGDDIVAFFPFQRMSSTHAEPVGGRLNDWHGVIATHSAQVNLELLFKKIGINSFGFHAMTNTNCDLSKYEFESLTTYHLDLSAGYDAYFSWAKQNSNTLKRHGQKARAMQRDFDVRFEFDCSQTHVLDHLIQLKREKYQRSNTFDILSVDWAAQLLTEILEVRSDRLQGLLSVLWADDQIAALHIGMLTANTLHYWFPVLDPQFSKYSPGTELLLNCAKEATARGIKKLDLGYGDDHYKLKFCNGRDTVACGQINFNSFQFELAKKRYKIRKQLKGIPMKKAVKRVFRRVFPKFGQGNFQ